MITKEKSTAKVIVKAEKPTAKNMAISAPQSPKEVRFMARAILATAERYGKLDPTETYSIPAYHGGGFRHINLMSSTFEPGVQKNFMVTLAKLGDLKLFFKVSDAVLAQHSREVDGMVKTGCFTQEYRSASPFNDVPLQTNMTVILGFAKALGIVKPLVQGSIDLLKGYARALEGVAYENGMKNCDMLAGYANAK